MSRLHIAMLSLLGIAAPLAFGQPPANEGPKSVPKAVSPDDAEHSPTQGNASKDTAAPNKARDTRGATSGATSTSKAKGKSPPARDDRTQGARSKDDAEHAPTKRTDEDKDAPATSGAKRPSSQ